MAIRRAKQKAQVIAKLSQSAPPGETFIACVHTETGPSPWLNALFDEVPFLGLIVALTAQVLLHHADEHVDRRQHGQPLHEPPRRGRVRVPPRRVPGQPASSARRVWSSMYVQLPGSAKPTRLNIHRYWRNEFDQLIAALPQAQVPAQAAPAPPAAAEHALTPRHHRPRCRHDPGSSGCPHRRQGACASASGPHVALAAVR